MNWHIFKILFPNNWKDWIYDSVGISLALFVMIPITAIVIPFSKDFKKDDDYPTIVKFVTMLSITYLLTFILTYNVFYYMSFLLLLLTSSMITIFALFMMCMVIMVRSDILYH